MSMCEGSHAMTHVEVRGQLHGVDSLLSPLLGSGDGLNSGHQDCEVSTLPSELSGCLPPLEIFLDCFPSIIHQDMCIVM